MSNTTFDRVSTIVLLLVTSVIAAGVIRQTFLRSSNVEAAEPEPVYVQNWRVGWELGTLLHGEEDAPVKLLVVVDFECPACKAFHAVLDNTIAEAEGHLAVKYVDYPLDYHPNAVPAAKASHCASEAHRYTAFVSELYAQSDALGVVGWGALAHQAGIADTAGVSRCANEPGIPPRIEASKEFVEAAGGRGTPTIFVNGWRLPNIPGRDALLQMVDSITEGTLELPAFRVIAE